VPVQLFQLRTRNLMIRSMRIIFSHQQVAGSPRACYLLVLQPAACARSSSSPLPAADLHTIKSGDQPLRVRISFRTGITKLAAGVFRLGKVVPFRGLDNFLLRLQGVVPQWTQYSAQARLQTRPASSRGEQKRKFVSANFKVHCSA
jgi:hypothetical protein